MLKYHNNTMKYQKSMLKVFENLFKSREGKSIEEIIRETHTGRNSTFKAVEWMEEKGIVTINNHGKQRIVSVIIDNYTLQYKYYLDFITLKTLNPLVRTISMILSDNINNPRIKVALLYGSALTNKDYNDIDIMILGDELNNEDIRTLDSTKEKLERVFEVVINIHRGELNNENVLQGVVIYQSSYIKSSDKARKEYYEYLGWMLEAIKNSKDKKIFEDSLNKALINLSYAYSYIDSYYPKTKEESLNYIKKNNDVGNFKKIKTRGQEIGERIFK